MKYTAPEDAARAATILSFPKRRRGRPKQSRPSRDMGTPELVMKRLMGETMEALDLCLERGIINDQQHWCGIHLRWLYTLRHGAPGVRAVDPTHLGGITIKNDDPLWRAAREMEYHDAIHLLAGSGHALIIMNLCIYNERPFFLKCSELRQNLPKPDRIAATETAIIKLREGFDLLLRHWKRKAAKS